VTSLSLPLPFYPVLPRHRHTFYLVRVDSSNGNSCSFYVGRAARRRFWRWRPSSLPSSFPLSQLDSPSSPSLLPTPQLFPSLVSITARTLHFSSKSLLHTQRLVVLQHPFVRPSPRAQQEAPPPSRILNCYHGQLNSKEDQFWVKLDRVVLY